MVRIYGNRSLKTLAGLSTRPTTARVREAVFHRWRHQLRGCYWLDLCAGSGSMGAEALCRDAAIVCGIEQSGKACQVIRQNWQPLTRSGQQLQIIRGDVVKMIAKLQGQSFDLIYFDPPYASELYEPVLGAIATHQLLKPTGELAVEHNPKQGFTLTPPTLEVCHTQTYGNTALTFFQLACGL